MSDKWIRQKLTARFGSDAHLGSGSGGEGVDALVARDRHDRPVVWASHVEGVLRDAARRLYDNDAGDLFGRAGGERQRAVFTSLYVGTNENPESHVWRSTAREAFDNRAPKDDSLRVIEYVPKGTEFVGEVELPASQLATLQRLVQEVDALGGGRSTGAGRVTLALSPSTIASRKSEASTGRLVLLLKNRDPLCITATATPDNLIPSLAYVPGRVLLGAIAAWLIAEGDRETAALLTAGNVSVSDALPLPHQPPKLEDVEVLPAPLSLQSEKPSGAAKGLPWWAQSIEPTKRHDRWSAEPKAKLKRPEDDLFVYRENSSASWSTFRPALRVRLRNGRPNPNQLDTSLFAIEQIVEETYFLAELNGSKEDMEKLAGRLGPVLTAQRWLRVGRAGAPVEVTRLAWCGATPVHSATDRVLLTLTSDLLVRDELLRWRTALDGGVLTEMLGEDVCIAKSLQDSVPIHGFNGTSRLWRMPAAAVRRGSVFALSGRGIATLAKRAASNEWLGERTHEGFGRFRLDSMLPGVTHTSVESRASSPVADVDEDAIAATTLTWINEHHALAKRGSASDPKPSLSQWLDLVGDLERNDRAALSSRLAPTTAGAKSWQHKDAKAVLDKLNSNGTTAEQKALHARYFVRWLRAEMRKQSKETR